MLNEKLEIEALLEGKRLDKKHTYRSCYLLAKHFKEQELDTIETRNAIFEWANKYDVFISDDLNSLVQRAFSDKYGITNNIQIDISKKNIQDIISRFDRYNVRLLAFAILCFAKIHADKNGIFYLSHVGLSSWIGIDRKNLNKYFKELIDFKFIEKVTQTELLKLKYKNTILSKMNCYKILINLNTGYDYIFKDEDIINEFKKIFAYI